MKTLLTLCLLPFLCILCPHVSTAQTVAGTLPSGANLQSPGLNMVVDTVEESRTETLDLNCDGQPDLAFTISFGYIALDAPSSAHLTVLNNDIEICGHEPMVSYHPQAIQHQSGDLLDCSGNNNWFTDTTITLGWWGGFVPLQPFTATNRYLAFREGSNVGWVRISYNVDQSLGAVFLEVDELALFCMTNSVDNASFLPATLVYPNPVQAGFTVDFGEVTSGITVRLISTMGREVLSETYGQTNQVYLTPNAAPGYYLLEISNEAGLRNTQPLILR